MSSNTPLFVPQVEESSIVHDGFVKIRRDLLRLPNDHSYQYYTLIARSSATVVLATTSEGKLVLVEEYRHPVKAVLLSCPGGYLDSEDEDPCDAARRELFEETGYTAERFELMGSAYPYPGISSQKIYFVHAAGAIWKAEPELEASEVLRHVILTRSQLASEIAAGKLIDGNMCTALFFHDLHKA